MQCTKCKIEHDNNEFRYRKNRSGKYYQLKVCIHCERIIKNKSEKKRYSNFDEKQKAQHIERSRSASTKESYKAWRRKWQKEKDKNDLLFRLKRRISTLLRYHLKKEDSVSKIFPYTIEELKAHLESQFDSWMSWNNWGKYDSATWKDKDSSTWTWQIDHIVPVFKFSYTSYTDDEFQRCWGLSNLRPLSAKENILKGCK